MHIGNREAMVVLPSPQVHATSAKRCINSLGTTAMDILHNSDGSGVF